MVANNAEHKKRFEKIIQVAVAFYAALTGFGLKHMLDAERSSDYLSANIYKWPFFIVAMLLFFRILAGAANHLWAEYVRGHPKYVSSGEPTPSHVTNRLLIKDVAFLTVFGLFAELMCYARSPQAFFLAGLVFLIVASVWSAMHLIPRYIWHIATVDDWIFWAVLDPLMAVAFFFAWLMWGNSSPILGWTLPILGWNSSLTMLVTISIIFFFIDLSRQFEQLQSRQFEQLQVVWAQGVVITDMTPAQVLEQAATHMAGRGFDIESRLANAVNFSFREEPNLILGLVLLLLGIVPGLLYFLLAGGDRRATLLVDEQGDGCRVYVDGDASALRDELRTWVLGLPRSVIPQ
jgi:hypothetical protein